MANAGRKLLRLVIMILLARLLTPEEFGIVAVMTAVFAVAAVFQEFGLSAATVQRDRVSTQAISTLFWINAGIGVLLTLLFMAMAPWIAAYMNRPELLLLCRVAAASFLINGIAVQYRALLQRDMQFSRQAAVDVVAAVLGGGAALWMAYHGWGYWSLVVQVLVTDALTLLLLLRAMPFVPGRPAYTPEVASMLRFGTSLLGFNFLVVLSHNLYVFLLGRWAGVAATGVYTRAYVLATVPQGLLYNAASYVALPNLARAKATDAQFADFYYRGVQLLALVTAPLSVAFVVFGDQIAQLVYGQQWDGVAELLAILALGMGAVPLMNSTGQVFLSRGESQRMLRWGVFGSCVICAGTLLGLGWGAVGVAWGWSGSMLLLLFPCLAYTYRGTVLSLGGLARAVGGVYLAGLCMLPLSWLVRQACMALPQGLQLSAALGVCLLVYLGLCYFVFGQKSLITTVVRSIFMGDKRGIQ